MCVPSLSWQNDRFYKDIAQKGRFPQADGSRFHLAGLPADSCEPITDELLLCFVLCCSEMINF
jgi:hypothetical protein